MRIIQDPEIERIILKQPYIFGLRIVGWFGVSLVLVTLAYYFMRWFG